MKFFLFTIALAAGAEAAATEALNGLSVGMGIEYEPIAKLEYANDSQPEQDVVDNFSFEPGVYYNFTNGLRAGAIFSYYSKKIPRTDTRTTDLSSWGIGFLGDYGFELTESGTTFLVGGMEAGYSELTDKNEFSDRTKGGVWIAGIGGIRHYFGRSISLEMDFRMKWLQYDFTETPKKNYDFSGSAIRLTLGYGFLFSKGKRSHP